MIRVLAVALTALLAAGCLEATPGTASGPDAAAEADAGPQPLKIDMLWIMEPGDSAAVTAQALFVDALPGLLAGLEAAGPVDLRFAVTSADAQCEPNPERYLGATRGQFNRWPTQGYPAGSYLGERLVCTADADCDRPGEEGLWRCRKEVLEVCIENPNGSINTECRRLCQTDAECRQAFGRDTLECLTPGDSPSDWGCVERARTEGCPALLPPFLEDADRDLLRCTASLGVASEKCRKFEQGLQAARMALDPAGPNPAQAASFLREDAWLFLGFLVQETDCALKEGETLGEDYYATCGHGVPGVPDEVLAPVSGFVAAYRALKADPDQVFVAVIGGDSLAPDEATRAAERAAFVEALAAPRRCHQKALVCTGYTWGARWSPRYAELVAAFGDRGAFANYCADDYGPAMTAIADAFQRAARP